MKCSFLKVYSVFTAFYLPLHIVNEYFSAASDLAIMLGHYLSSLTHTVLIRYDFFSV